MTQLSASLERARRSPLDGATALLAGAHALLLAAFFLPWVGGSFGERSTLSGLELARLSPEAASGDLVAALGPHAWALYLLPALALDGLLLALLGERLGLGRLARPLSFTFALPGAAVALVLLATVGLDGSLLRAPQWGLALLLIAIACLAASLVESARTGEPLR